MTSNPPRAGDSRVSKIRARLIISLEITKGLNFLACLTHILSPGKFPQAKEGLPHSPLYPLSVLTSSSPLPFFIFVKLVLPEEDFDFFSFYSLSPIKSPLWQIYE